MWMCVPVMAVPGYNPAVSGTGAFQLRLGRTGTDLPTANASVGTEAGRHRNRPARRGCDAEQLRYPQKFHEKQLLRTVS